MYPRNKNRKPGLSPTGPETVIEKIRHFYSFSERSEKEVLLKMKSLKISGTTLAAVIKQLRDEGFINDERYARAFARGKWRVNHWGRIKIGYELRAKGLPEKIVSRALKEIPEDEYIEKLREMVWKYVGKNVECENISGEKVLLKQKIFNFALGKGYEANLVSRILNELNF